MSGTGGAGQMLMNPMGTAQGLAGTMSDPQKMLAGFVGPTAAGVKGAPPPSPGVKPPGGSAMTPQSFGDLQSKYSVGGGSDMMDPETQKFLAMLAGGR